MADVIDGATHPSGSDPDIFSDRQTSEDVRESGDVDQCRDPDNSKDVDQSSNVNRSEDEKKLVNIETSVVEDKSVRKERNSNEDQRTTISKSDITPNHDHLQNKNQAAVEKLTYGVMAAVLPSLQNSQTTLTEVIENQRILMETLQQENAKFRECTDFLEIQKMMTKAKHYHNKLLAIKRDMVMLHEKSAKLKKRALKLQGHKQKQVFEEEQAREEELEREQKLAARLSSSKR